MAEKDTRGLDPERLAQSANQPSELFTAPATGDSVDQLFADLNGLLDECRQFIIEGRAILAELQARCGQMPASEPSPRTSVGEHSGSAPMGHRPFQPDPPVGALMPERER